MEADLRTKTWDFNGKKVIARWKSVDMSKYLTHFSAGEVKDTLQECGVYIPPNVDENGINIYISNLLDDDLQALSALHEELCVNNGANPCHEVESALVRWITDPCVRNDYLSLRIRMFKAIVEIYPEKAEFKTTLDTLISLNSE